MKVSFKALLVFISILTFPGIITAADFRDVDWGMTLEQVKTAESLKLVKQTVNKLLYSLDLADFDTKLTYHITNGIRNLWHCCYGPYKGWWR